ncbi:hypothetical protein [Bordetella trematum]|uniref:hypothetical protein n=1 Tax=Bordetella trematum TaxID=123899 RepID=UPI00140431BD|nr:hypothetical protein [Bordetella trematum]QIM71835.1 hypothetical protein EYB34_10925 [Bordetella trematum]
MLEHIKAHSILRDIGVKTVKVERENGAASVRAILKSGDEFRQYAKHSQSLARKARRGREQAMATGFQDRRVVLDAVVLHVRNEVRIHEKTLRQHGLEHPGSWPEGGLCGVLHDVVRRAGLSSVGAVIPRSSAIF